MVWRVLNWVVYHCIGSDIFWGIGKVVKGPNLKKVKWNVRNSVFSCHFLVIFFLSGYCRLTVRLLTLNTYDSKLFCFTSLPIKKTFDFPYKLSADPRKMYGESSYLFHFSNNVAFTKKYDELTPNEKNTCW